MMSDFLKGALDSLHGSTVTDHSNLVTDAIFTGVSVLNPERKSKNHNPLPDEPHDSAEFRNPTPEEQARLDQINRDNETYKSFMRWVYISLGIVFLFSAGGIVS